jgi:hypothetical protein
MNNLEFLEKLAYSIIKEETDNASEWSVSIQYTSLPNSGIESGVVLESLEIYISIDPRFVLDEKSKTYLKSKGRKTDISTVVEDIVRHEIGHVKYCPRNNSLEEEIAQGVFDGLYKGWHKCECSPSLYEDGFSRIISPEGVKYGGYLINGFEDIIVNSHVVNSLRRKKRNFAGLACFYYNNARNVGEFQPVEAFLLRVNELLWMDKKDKNFLKEIYSIDPRISRKVEKCTNELFRELHLRKGESNLEYNLSVLSHEDRWKNYAETFAKIAFELL